jgi:hypothetical protein
MPSNNHIQQEAIIVFREKLKTPFRINPIPSILILVWFGLFFLLSSQYQFAITKDHSWAEDR